MKLCVFQGTFNPIHNAHLKMAEFVLKNFGFDKILFIPAYKPPHKDYNAALTPHRLEMVKLATEYNKKFEVSDIEYKREGPSYTYLTILELYKKYKIDGKIYFIIGTDAFKKIDSWYEADKLKRLIRFIVFNRSDINENYDNNCEYELATMNFEDISSTEIREKILKNQSIKDIVPRVIEEYINANGIYKN